MSEPLLQRRRVLQAKKFAVDAVDLPTARGTTLERHVVVHSGAVVILPILPDGRIVLIRNERFAIGQTLWELAAGTLEVGEDPGVCAARELIEETGYQADHLEPLVEFYPSPGICTELMRVFVATSLQHVGQKLEPDEKIEVDAVTPGQLLDMIQSNTIRDAKTIASFLYYRTFVADKA